MRGAKLACGLLLLIGCGAGGDASPDAAAPLDRVASSPGAAGSPAVTDSPAEATLPDPEPPDAQALAEESLALASNRDKTSRLAMSMTTLVDRRTGLAGLHSAVRGEERSLDQRLTALGAEITGTEVVIRLPGSVLFDFDSDAIRPDAERTLAEVAAVLTAHAGRPVRIEGHTDSIASESYNLDLSRRRAESVRRWLGAHGVGVSEFEIVGHGESQPVADNGTPEGRQRNRRVEVIIERAA